MKSCETEGKRSKAAKEKEILQDIISLKNDYKNADIVDEDRISSHELSRLTYNAEEDLENANATIEYYQNKIKELQEF